MMAASVAVVLGLLLGTTPMEQITAHENGGDDAGALAWAEYWAQTEPRSPYGHLEAARLGLKLGKSLETVDWHLRWAYALAPDNPRGLHLWGLLEEERGDVEGARGAQRKAIALRADYLDAHRRLAALAQRASDWPEAERELQYLIRAGDGDTGLKLQLASVQEKSGQGAQAERTLTELHKAQPKNTVVTRALADFYARTGRQKQATALLKTLEPQKKAMRSLSASRR
ncbi:MAG TPA: tetratricopeptide repeat protein [Myxococcaceae bacterium]|nr:tetratricopeptide repeat protein [Myxococcaceae bacterium]